ncbi:hypothetical protein ACIQ6R_27300 [Streptomyces sp. NPDC096048]|uniref:hypothetical protein n=1 Tax=Streptomyces sp. NPDC096048 TaxID=3366072 RepID=UPI0038093878
MGTWADEDEMSFVLDCSALPAQHLDLGLGLPGNGFLHLNEGIAPRWYAEDPQTELGHRAEDRRDGGDLHALAAWTHAEWWRPVQEGHSSEPHPALEEAIAEYEKHCGRLELVNHTITPWSSTSVQLGGSLVHTLQDPPELHLIDLPEDWDWRFDDEILRKASIWRLFAQMPMENGLVNDWLIHQDDRTVERYDEVMWLEEAD